MGSGNAPHQVTCAPTLRRGGRVTHSRLSTPRHASKSAVPAFGPSVARNLATLVATMSRQVIVSVVSANMFFFSFSSAPVPTPGNSPTGNEETYSRASPLSTKNTPSGFACFVASRAIKRLGPYDR